ncbi:hypothetical protein IMSAG192_01536 [Muribaculaceae bacterium]|nr:hypothetical protein IMSAG192_01536 [Muribaculaceae bacterium]
MKCFIIVFSRHLPSVTVNIMINQHHRCADWRKTVCNINLHSTDRILVMTSPIEVYSLVIILPQTRVMLSDFKPTFNFAP